MGFYKTSAVKVLCETGAWSTLTIANTLKNIISVNCTPIVSNKL